MANLSYAQLESVWIQAGGSAAQAPLMAAIALAESSGDPNSTNPTDNGGRQTSWGLWQISTGTHAEPAPNWNDPIENAKLALGKLRTQGLRAWGTYTSGAYKRYLQSGVTPSGSGISGGGTTPASANIQQATWYEPWTWSIWGGIGSSITGAIGAVFAPVIKFFDNVSQALVAVMKGVLWIINPMNWVRIFAGILGSVTLAVGLFFVLRAA